MLRKLEEVAESLRKTDGVKAAYLFGSYATGKEKPYSDLDVCVITEPDVSEKTKREILSNSSRNIDIKLFWSLPPSIRIRVIREGRPLFEKDRLLVHRAKTSAIRQYLDLKPLLDLHYARMLG